MKDAWELYKQSFRWWMASKFIKWAIRLTHEDMDGPTAQTAYAFIVRFRDMNRKLGGLS